MTGLHPSERGLPMQTSTRQRLVQQVFVTAALIAGLRECLALAWAQRHRRRA